MYQTGTLTEDGLDMWGVVPSSNGRFEDSEKEVPRLKNHPLFEGMLVCHSLTIIDNELCGDPLDVKVKKKKLKITFKKIRNLNFS